jgi:thioredoxin reductase
MNTPALPVSMNESVNLWLSAFERALATGSTEGIRACLWSEEIHWRDLMAFTWTISPHDTPDDAVVSLLAGQAKVHARNFRVDSARTKPQIVTRHGVRVIEAFISFETEYARCSGILRLVADQPDKAFTFATRLDELKGNEEPINLRRPTGEAFSRTFGGANWSDNRARDLAYSDRDPAVLIIGAGQFGLAIAARLRLLGVDALVVDTRARVGDIWRERYHSLALHNQVKLNHMPYLPWPPNWPRYLPKDMIAGWLENYAWAMECNVWTGTEFLGADYDKSTGQWNARLKLPDGGKRMMRPRHLVFANGIAGKPMTPMLPGLESYQGEVMHTHSYREGARWKAKNVIVVGAGTSGHDVAQDLHGHGAKVTMIQRGPATVASVKAAGLVHSVYYEGDTPLEECDLMAMASTYPLLVRNYQAAVVKMKEIDRDLLEGLAARGFKLDWGEDETGHQMKFRRRHGGYYLNCGCSELIVSGEIDLVQHEDTDGYVAEGLKLKDGSIRPADLVVTATGYQSQEALVREMLGDNIADRIGQIWGIDRESGEIANMFVATGQPGLWFAGGGFAHCRIYSHFIAIGIKARELGLIA